MKKNLLLQIALFFNQLFQFVIWLVLLVLVAGFIHWHINPEYYNTVQLEVKENDVSFTKAERVTTKKLPGQDKIKVTTKVGNAKKAGAEYFYVNDLNAISRYFTYLQILLEGILLLLVLREIARVIKSVQELKTFSTNNVKAFRRIGYLCLLIVLINCFYFIGTTQHIYAKFNLEFTPLFYMLAAFIMAEIFKEGNNLYEQDRLTI